MEITAIILSSLSIIFSVVILITLFATRSKLSVKDIKKEIDDSFEKSVSNIHREFETVVNSQDKSNRFLADTLDKSMNTLRKTVTDELESIRKTNETSIKNMQTDNEKRLNEIKEVVDEKLQKTLNERFTQSFEAVSNRLEEVNKGLGEMKSLASSVGDLKTALTNVKTKGNFGEVQLENILSEIMPSQLWEKQFKINPRKNEFVDFAIKLPGDGETPLWLPIDSKFPTTSYTALLSAIDSGNKELMELERKKLVNDLKIQAKSIKEKYISENTTNFAIMFLPSEGLYAEAARSELIEMFQRDYSINIAGPSTIVAFLNSLMLGFQTLKIQKRSVEIQTTLGAVKKEFEAFGGILEKTQKKLREADENLDKLVGVRTRVINSKLKNISALDEDSTAKILPNSLDISEEE